VCNRSWCDWYHFEHITYFDDWEHLVHLLSFNFSYDKRQDIHMKMKQSNKNTKSTLIKQWKDILYRATGLETLSNRYLFKNDEAVMSTASSKSTINSIHDGIHDEEDDDDENRLLRRKMPNLDESYESRMMSLFPKSLLDQSRLHRWQRTPHQQEEEEEEEEDDDDDTKWKNHHKSMPPNMKQNWIDSFDIAKLYGEKACKWLEDPVSPTWQEYVHQVDQISNRRRSIRLENSNNNNMKDQVKMTSGKEGTRPRRHYVQFKVEDNQLQYDFDVLSYCQLVKGSLYDKDTSSFPLLGSDCTTCRYILIECGLNCPLVALAEVYVHLWNNNDVREEEEEEEEEAGERKESVKKKKKKKTMQELLRPSSVIMSSGANSLFYEFGNSKFNVYGPKLAMDGNISTFTST
jgi:hypothetical protein